MAKKTQKTTPKSSETRAASVAAWQASRTPEERAASARKAAETRAANRMERAAPVDKGDARRFVFTRADGTKVRVTRAEKQRRERLQAAAFERRGLVRVETSRGSRYLPPDEAKRRAAAVELGRAQAARRKGPTQTPRVETNEREAPRTPPPESPTQTRWVSELTYLRGDGIGDLRSWLEDLLDAAEEDAALDGADPYSTPWRVVGGMESASGVGSGSSSFAVLASGTRGERGNQIMKAAVAALAQAAPAEGIDPKYTEAARGRSRGRAAVPLDDEAKAAAAAARAKFAGPREDVRIETQVVPVYPDDPAMPTTDAGDDGEDFDFFDDGEDVPF